MTGLLAKAKNAMKKRAADRRVNNLFSSPQGFDRRKAVDRRLENMPIQTIEPPE